MMESNIQRAFQRLLKTVLNPNAWHLVPIKKTEVTEITATGWGKTKQRLTFGGWDRLSTMAPQGGNSALPWSHLCLIGEPQHWP